MRYTIFAVAAPLLLSQHAFSQSKPDEAANYPNRPVQIIVPFPPGGGSEAFARSIAAKLTPLWGQQVIIDNRGGAGGTIGSYLVVKAPPDGYTLLMGLNGTHGMAQSLYRKLPYDTVRDFTPITMVGIGPNILTVHPSVPVKSVKELIALAKAKPGQLNYGSPGNGTPPHLQMAVFNKLARTKMTHVPYKGGGPANVALLSGEVQLAFTAVTVGLPHVEAGKLRALGLSGAKKPASLSKFPTVAESGLPGYDENTWYGIFGPAGMPPAIVNKLNADLVKVLSSPELKERFAQQGQEMVGNSPERFREIVKAEVAKWAEVIKELGLQLD
ncbi:MAG: tripartite tricarboxylate transporter substrate binding protein [Betaproteobacteria bacterium]|nr:tripartite tricarboxylate transporter substrate binding protein [Betaproteobacteria bacterium]